MKKSYDMRVRPAKFSVGMWVYYYNPRRYQGRSPKWQCMFTGPDVIMRMLDPVNAVIQQSKRSKPLVCHVDKLKPCEGETPAHWFETSEDVSTDVNRPDEMEEDVVPVGNDVVADDDCADRADALIQSELCELPLRRSNRLNRRCPKRFRQ